VLGGAVQNGDRKLQVFLPPLLFCVRAEKKL
jgi:hypothetical protein